MAEVITSDGYCLWFEVVGDGPALVFPSRTRQEYHDVAVALSERYRVVRYTPRQVTGVERCVRSSVERAGGSPVWAGMRPGVERADGGPTIWASSAFDHFPVDMEIADLHCVADAAAADEFVLAGYSGMGALAAHLAPCSRRAVGLLVGGFPPLGPWDYWLGAADGARLGYLDAGLSPLAEHAYAGTLMFRAWMQRDDTAALAGLPGPKIVWYGGNDGEPGCALHAVLSGANIARRIRAATGALRELGFEVVEIPDLDHAMGLYDTQTVAAALTSSLPQSW